MPLSQDTLRFIREHRCDDVRSLALQARRYPSVDMPAAITQISGWQIAKEKIPAWAENEHILYPARRDGHGGKTVAIGDCEPDIAALEELLLRKARHVLVKLSPMLDLTLALNDLKHVHQAHIVSVGNECKELLLLLGQGEGVPADDIPIHCVNFTGVPAPQALVFTRRQEKERACPYTPQLKSYLYEPNASVLKASAFRSLSSLYKVEKLHPNSHLYTSDHFLPDFPGRKFRITSSCGFGKKEVKEMLAAEKKANLTVRNFPATVAELRKRLKLAEGGGTYLFATTLADEKKVLIRCQATG